MLNYVITDFPGSWAGGPPLALTPMDFRILVVEDGKNTDKYIDVTAEPYTTRKLDQYGNIIEMAELDTIEFNFYIFMDANHNRVSPILWDIMRDVVLDINKKDKFWKWNGSEVHYLEEDKEQHIWKVQFLFHVTPRNVEKKEIKKLGRKLFHGYGGKLYD